MNRSWRNYSNNSSAGFVYFNTSNSNQSQHNSSTDTSDFLSFNQSQNYESPPSYKFSPSNYSSPQKFHRSPRNFNQQNNYRYSGGNYNHSPNNSYNHNNSYNNRRWDNGEQNRRRSFHKVNKGQTQNTQNKNGLSVYYDHTCLKDPWLELEQKLKAEEQAEKNKIIINPNFSDSSGSESESESEEKSSEKSDENEAES